MQAIVSSVRTLQVRNLVCRVCCSDCVPTAQPVNTELPAATTTSAAWLACRRKATLLVAGWSERGGKSGWWEREWGGGREGDRH
eukprot:7927719-Pyramimonas_sp.AAC.2